MSSSTDLTLGTKSIRSRADYEDYVNNFNANNKVGFAAYYSQDAVFKFSNWPDRTVHEFLTWVDNVHSHVHETLNLKRVVFSRDVVVAEIDTQFRGINGFETDNMEGRWGPVWLENGPLVKMYAWYTLNKEGHIIGVTEDAFLIKAASKGVIRSRADLDHYLGSFNTNDFDAFSRYYTSDVTIDFDGKQTLNGKDEAIKLLRDARERVNEEVTVQSIVMDKASVAIKSEIKFTAIANIEDILHFGSGVRKGGGYKAQFLVYYQLSPEGKILHIIAARCGSAKIFNPA